jgi:hypothetical protein
VRILLDECIDENLRHGFTGHECHTCRYAGLKGLANGELLAAAEKAGYDVLITIDKNDAASAESAWPWLSLIVLDGHSTSIDDLVSLMSDVLTALDVLQPGQFLRIAAR